MRPLITRFMPHLALLLCALPTEAQVFVNASATGANNGTTWADAYIDLQQALVNAPSGAEIWVAAGTHHPGPPGDALSSFVLRSGIAVYGGFAGYETERDQRDWVAHPTVLSGDVGDDDVYGNPWYQGWNIHSANSGHVVVGSGVDASAVLDGFRITAGHTGPVGTPAGDPLMYGSGMYIVAGSPTIRSCVFSRNLAAFASGGAIYCYNASPSITACTFSQNYVHLGNGAGVAVVGNAAPSISDCLFTENQAIADSGNTGQGAGISINFLTAPLEITIERCRFESNIARTFYPAGGVEIARGGGISNFGATLTVRNCHFRNNSANAGAGIQTWDAATITNCLFRGNSVYSHDFGAGSDGGYGAGICIYSFQPDVATVLNCTIAKNSGAEGVGVQSLASASFVIRNSVIWGNVANGQDVSPIDAQIKGDVSAQYSCIQDLLTPIPGEDPPDPANYPGCIVVNPQLVNIDTGDLHLSAGSPCVDAGRNSYLPAGVLTDLDDLNRFVDDPMVPDTGYCCPPIVDMGSYERQVPLPLGDLNCDHVVSPADIPEFVAALIGNYTGCDITLADMDDSGDANGADIQLFVNKLLGV